MNKVEKFYFCGGVCMGAMLAVAALVLLGRL